jgi:hypothetical protein
MPEPRFTYEQSEQYPFHIRQERSHGTQYLRSELPLRRDSLQSHAGKCISTRRHDEGESMQLLDMHKVWYVERV